MTKNNLKIKGVANKDITQRELRSKKTIFCIAGAYLNKLLPQKTVKFITDFDRKYTWFTYSFVILITSLIIGLILLPMLANAIVYTVDLLFNDMLSLPEI